MNRFDNGRLDGKEAIAPAGPTVPEQYRPNEASGAVVDVEQLRLVLTVEEAAGCLGIGRSMMYTLVMSGEVESVLIGRLRRIPVDALTAYVAKLRDPNASTPGSVV